MCRTHAVFSEEGNTRVVTLDPVTIEFSDLTVKVISEFLLTEGSGEVKIVCKIKDISSPDVLIGIDEYITSCYGTTEYPEDMSGIELSVDSPGQSEKIFYAYQCREMLQENANQVQAVIAQILPYKCVGKDK